MGGAGHHGNRGSTDVRGERFWPDAGPTRSRLTLAIQLHAHVCVCMQCHPAQRAEGETRVQLWKTCNIKVEYNSKQGVRD